MLPLLRILLTPAKATELDVWDKQFDEDYKPKKKPSDFDLKGNIWTGKVVQKFLKKGFNKNFSLSAAYKIYHKVGASKMGVLAEKEIIIDDALLLIIKKYRAKLVYNLIHDNAP